MTRRPALLAVGLVLVAATDVSAHELTERRAQSEAERVVSVVAGLLSIDYDVRRSAVEHCSPRTEHKVACRVRWDLESRRSDRRWRCRTTVVVWLPDPEGPEPEWDYGRVTCPRLPAA